MTAPQERPLTLADLYADRELTDAQTRRIVALLGLARGARNGVGAGTPTPPENTRQQAS